MRTRAKTCATRSSTTISAPLFRLNVYIENTKTRMLTKDMQDGCLFGNFTSEISQHSPAMRDKINGVFAETRASFAYCLRAAIAAGEVPAELDCDEVAGFMVSSLQGAILLSKSEGSPAPIERFQHILFSKVLR